MLHCAKSTTRPHIYQISGVWSVWQYLSNEILVLHHAQLSPYSLGDPFPCHQVANQHRSWTNVH